MNKNEALDFLKRLSNGVAIMFGGTCEALVHDMSVPNHPIVYITNGHVTNRNIGSTEDVYGVFTEDEDVFLNKDFINNLVITRSGKKLKSSTFHMKGDGYHYAFGINFDFTCMYEFSKIQNDFMQVDSELQDAINENGDSNRLPLIFESCLDAIGKPIDKLNRSDRIRLISMLKAQKAFSFQKSVPYISEKLNLSRNTIYKYIKEIE